MSDHEDISGGDTSRAVAGLAVLTVLVPCMTAYHVQEWTEKNNLADAVFVSVDTPQTLRIAISKAQAKYGLHFSGAFLAREDALDMEVYGLNGLNGWLDHTGVGESLRLFLDKAVLDWPPSKQQSYVDGVMREYAKFYLRLHHRVNNEVADAIKHLERVTGDTANEEYALIRDEEGKHFRRDYGKDDIGRYIADLKQEIHGKSLQLGGIEVLCDMQKASEALHHEHDQKTLILKPSDFAKPNNFSDRVLYDRADISTIRNQGARH